MRIGILGHFARNIDMYDGQTIKTRSIESALLSSNEAIMTVDSYNWKRHPFSFLIEIIRLVKKSDAIIMMPDAGGVKIYPSILKALSHKKKKLLYIVIGGWLPEFLKEKKSLSRKLKSFDGIYVETREMQMALETQGFNNIVLMPNCKDLKILKPEELVYPTEKPYKLCTFSRVMKEKGIEDAVDAVKAVNSKAGCIVYKLDIYGKVDSKQAQWFDELKASFPDYIRYAGVVNYDKSVSVLKDYFALLFPTHYESEGFAGTIIDAIASGVPVIASDWRYNAEIVNENVGFVYPTNDRAALINILELALSNPETILQKKRSCIEEAKKYTSNIVIEKLRSRL